MGSTVVVHYLLAGRWHMALLNDNPIAVQPIRFVTSLVDDDHRSSLDNEDNAADTTHSDMDCKYDCSGKGECKAGHCRCFSGYTGPFCEESK
jgi:hypothetical protein